MSATHGGQAAHWVITPASGARSRIVSSEPPPAAPETATSPSPTTMMPELPPSSLDLPRFFYELDAFFQSARKIEAALQEEQRKNAQLRDQLKRQEVEADRRLSEAQERIKTVSEQAKKAHELVQNLQKQMSRSQMDLQQARDQWRINHDKAATLSAESKSRTDRITELEQALAEARTQAEQAKMDLELAGHEKETEMRTAVFEKEGLLKRYRDLDIRFGQMEHRYKVEKDSRERIEAYAKNCYQELVKERRRGASR